MAPDLKEIIEQLKLQRDIVKDGGYGRSVRTPWKEERLFRDSITCLNVTEEVKKHPCNECLLWEWVPEDHKDEDIPCHFIPLNAARQKHRGAGRSRQARRSRAGVAGLVRFHDSAVGRETCQVNRQLSVVRGPSSRASQPGVAGPNKSGLGSRGWHDSERPFQVPDDTSPRDRLVFLVLVNPWSSRR